jgi:hypothetical protein
MGHAKCGGHAPNCERAVRIGNFTGKIYRDEVHPYFHDITAHRNRARLGGESVGQRIEGTNVSQCGGSIKLV